MNLLDLVQLLMNALLAIILAVRAPSFYREIADEKSHPTLILINYEFENIRISEKIR